VLAGVDVQLRRAHAADQYGRGETTTAATFAVVLVCKALVDDEEPSRWWRRRRRNRGRFFVSMWRNSSWFRSACGT
jgi:hypothetical protein